MNNRLGTIIVVALALLLSACRAEYKDISSEPEYSQYIGKQYKLISDMDYSGVNLSRGYSDEIHVYIISSRDPGWSGPEVVTRETLPTGSVVIISKVEECTNCLTFGAPLRRAQVEIKGVPSINLPIQLDFDQILSGKHLERVQ
ncbi:hypothetical protein [Microbulbifer sp. JTAC008]|uniref:hypothetical protein n=1 Tax=unclassified Microbulbifer TaxID=2619833 RepID=UPI0040396617